VGEVMRHALCLVQLGCGYLKNSPAPTDCSRKAR
jgi:hypothetical protein